MDFALELAYTAHQVTVGPFNPFDPIDSETLFQWALSLALTCGRAKSTTHKPRVGHMCSLFELVKNELNHRGDPVPVPPYFSGSPPRKA